ncbi:MAG: chromate transporter, partial [Pygmaiobacter sp.]
MIYLELFYEFAKTGLFALGGGLATIPFLMELPGKYGWFTASELTDMIAISESTPGPIGVNMATYAGFKTAGVPGALVASFGLVLPSVVIILIIAKFLAGFSEKPLVKHVFYGLRPAVCALIGGAAVALLQSCLLSGGVLNVRLLLLFLAGLIPLNLKWTRNIHPAIWLLVAATLGIVLK